MISAFCLLNRRALVSCFLHQSLPLPWFNFPILGSLYKRVIFGFGVFPTSFGFVSASHSPCTWLISGKGAFSLLSGSGSPGKDAVGMKEDLHGWRRGSLLDDLRRDGREVRPEKEGPTKGVSASLIGGHKSKIIKGKFEVSRRKTEGVKQCLLLREMWGLMQARSSLHLTHLFGMFLS